MRGRSALPKPGDARLSAAATPAALPGAGQTMIAPAPSRTDVPRDAIALRSYEPDAAEDETAAAAPAAQTAAAAVPAAGQIVSNIPLPPERPFDLGTIPNAASPVRATAAPMVLPPSRPVLAGLYYGPMEQTGAGFQKGTSFRTLSASNFVSIRSQN